MPSLARLSVALPLLLALAAPAPAQEKLAQTPYFPLAVGSAWTYKAGDGRFTVRVARHEKVGPVLTARLEVVADKKVVAFENVGVTPGAVVRYALDGKEAKPPVAFLKLPPKKGESWKVESALAGAPLKGAFKAGEEEVKVPAGTYKAVAVTAQDLEVNGVKVHLVCYYAAKVGLVKQVQEIAGRKLVIELENYEPGK
jgi:hypothetical protein